MTYSAQFYTEFVVFPSLLPVRGFEEVVHMMQGKQWSLFSPFEDVQLPVGTREYHYSDPFHRINWKASAKTQTLQTNVYEKNVDMGLVFIVNISVADNSHLTKLSKHLERSLSFCAYLCKIATEKGYHTSIHQCAQTRQCPICAFAGRGRENTLYASIGNDGQNPSPVHGCAVP